MSKNLIRGRLLASMFCFSFALPAAAAPLQVGFVYVSPIGQAGWTYQHDQARQAMQRALGDKVTTRFVEAVSFKPGAAAWRVEPAGPAGAESATSATETKLPTRFLER